MRFIIVFILLSVSCLYAQVNLNLVKDQIENGKFSKATTIIQKMLKDNKTSETEKLDLTFELERMDRIKEDFDKSEEDILKYLKKYYPNIKSKDLAKWEKTNQLEHKIIDGKKLYFTRSNSNLFLINPEAKKDKEKVDGVGVDGLNTFLDKYIPKVVDKYYKQNTNLTDPVKILIDYTLSVKPNVVPAGEIIRCWMPYPRETNRRQQNIKLISVNNNEYIVAGEEQKQRTIYLEKIAEKDKETVFNYELEYLAAAEFNKISIEKVKPYDVNSELYKEFSAERPPHIVFSEKIKKASQEIVGEEKNPYLAAKKIFTWIDKNIPWAGAREYSTLYNISDYCITNGHGDCGIKTLLFMTLCRCNGIPTKWQSGWMLHPDNVNLHDWGEIYFEGYGWLPVDQSFGLTVSENEDVQYFYLGGIDSYRLIVNDDFSVPLFPAKIYPRSETVDFQRGEVEWRGGNLYFDKWDYDMQVKYSE
ncbi:MAG: transglutaminase domain-containing protein [bacterium]